MFCNKRPNHIKCDEFVRLLCLKSGRGLEFVKKRNTFGLEEKSYKGPSKKTGKAVIE